ncbi:HAMP domain-containing sensor histidine kinase [Kurthia sibirica]|uniref:histidine kinase n=1 Tax=Kurthia sibirica TaxID=202750 RepID=A0A2U3APU9_9BACL|nr:HAMP domain-containing sensor histidine kinase [Kurthia sibirica]PWI26580.1 sensor histidine kinase [Kurthia sibirica]
MKLKTKIHFFSTLLMLVILVITTVGVFTLFKDMAYDAAYDQLSRNTDNLMTSISQTSGVTNPEDILRAYLPNKSMIQVKNDQDEVILSVQSTDGLSQLKQGELKERYMITQIEGTAILSTVTPVIWSDGSIVNLHIKQKLEDVTTSLNTLSLVLLAMLLAGSLLIILSSMTLARIVVQPIKRLIDTMRKNSQSNSFEQIVDGSESNDELGEMTKTFNEMIFHIKQNYDKQHSFVSNASHELRTPLTVIESYTSLLHRRGIDNKEITAEALEAILSESERMRDLIEQMLDLAKSNQGRLLKFETLELQEMMQKINRKMELSYNRQIILSSKERWEIISDDKRLHQLFFIILENAKNYSDGPIEIHLRKKLRQIEIKDFGEGIAEKDLPHLFDRFYRVNQDRNRKTGGTGLGLAIAKNIAVQLNIELTIESELTVGTSVFLYFKEDDLYAEK